jgi:LmbE family N-acetylglucosaminyl deacetylase
MSAAQNPLTPEAVNMHGTSTNLETPKRALAIAAHPDDVEFGGGGTLAKWAAAGCEVSILVCTDGSKGTWDPVVDEEWLIATRQDEQRAAAQSLGATGQVVFLGHTDGELQSTLSERAQVALWIRTLRPDVVLGHDPWKRYRLHPDHRHAGLLTVEAVVAARDPKFFPTQGVAHHRPDRMLLWEADEPDHAEDVTGFAEAKFNALACHQTQHETTMLASNPADVQAADLSDFKRRVEAKLATAGEAVGFEHAEVFKLIDDL